MGRLQTLIFAVACGMLVANLYYAQPLIEPIGRDLGITQEMLGLIVTITQIGFCFGLLFLVPLADRLESRQFVVILVLGAAVAMVSAGLAGNWMIFLTAMIAVGIFSVAAQVIVPLAATLAPPEKLGSVIGVVMAGLLGGIMLARPISSALTELSGWRTAFILPGSLLILLAIILWFAVPVHRKDGVVSYPAIFRSMRALIAELPELRRRAFYQACMFAAFNIFWTAIPLALSQQLGFGQDQIAIFALAGAGGALAAPLAGRLGDKGLVWLGSAVAMATLAASLVLTIPALAIGSAVLLAILAILLDAATETNHVLSQKVIYSLRPEARGQINSIYMVTMFIGGSMGSAMAPLLYMTGGWAMCALVGLVFAAASLALFSTELRHPGASTR